MLTKMQQVWELKFAHETNDSNDRTGVGNNTDDRTCVVMEYKWNNRWSQQHMCSS